MNEKAMSVGTILRGYDTVYVKKSPDSWKAYDLSEEVTSDEIQEYFDADVPDAHKLVVLHKPDPKAVLEDLPSGSIVVGGESEVAIRYEEDWAVSGMEAWYDSDALLEMLGAEFEVVRRGDTV